MIEKNTYPKMRCTCPEMPMKESGGRYACPECEQWEKSKFPTKKEKKLKYTSQGSKLVRYHEALVRDFNNLVTYATMAKKYKTSEASIARYMRKIGMKRSHSIMNIRGHRRRKKRNE